jgi:nucleoside-diphosphate-sugar epimerase
MGRSTLATTTVCRKTAGVAVGSGSTEATLNLLPLQLGDVPDTFANVDNLMRDTGFKPATTVEEGVGKFVEWYREYYEV